MGIRNMFMSPEKRKQREEAIRQAKLDAELVIVRKEAMRKHLEKLQIKENLSKHFKGTIVKGFGFLAHGVGASLATVGSVGEIGGNLAWKGLKNKLGKGPKVPVSFKNEFNKSKLLKIAEKEVLNSVTYAKMTGKELISTIGNTALYGFKSI